MVILCFWRSWQGITTFIEGQEQSYEKASSSMTEVDGKQVINMEICWGCNIMKSTSEKSFNLLD